MTYFAFNSQVFFSFSLSLLPSKASNWHLDKENKNEAFSVKNELVNAESKFTERILNRLDDRNYATGRNGMAIENFTNHPLIEQEF